MMPKLTLIECLKIFNRKERYWLLRKALGDEKKSLPISKSFLKEVLKTFDIEESPSIEEVWWAMDYHFDWLASALVLYAKQEIEKPTLRTLSGPDSLYITGTQEDVDFVICFGKHIILIEAKGVTNWKIQQFESKFKRIELLKQFADTENCLRIHFKLLLLSPKKSDRLENHMNMFCKEDIPVKHIELDIPDEVNPNKVFQPQDNFIFLKPVRCHESGKENKSGEYWKISPTFMKPNK